MKHLLAALAGLIALAACGRGGGDVPTLNVGSQRGGTKAMMLASGALNGAPYKVEWSEFPAAQHLLEAIGGGSVDVGLVGDAPFMFAYQSGSPIKAVGAQFATGRPREALSLIVRANSPVRTIADLRGKIVAVTRGSVGHYLVIRALAAARLPPGYVRLTFLGPGDAKAAFDSGAVDAWAVWAPYLRPAREGGARVIADSSDLMRAYGFDVSNERSIAAKRALLADFLDREARALRWAHAHRAAYARVLARETGLPIDVAQDYVDKNPRERVPIDAAVIADQQQVLDDFRRAGAVTGARAPADAFERGLTDRKVAGTN